ncbi:ATP-binding protein [Chromobacterium violaceum]|uniref:ATP-binding protein n=1 Tax=Chromobacterium violaceum TaxID=536 RepID=UPI001C8BD5D0|nr:ATP-binding protein [Chromobacterium violaceum]MBX9267975.1 ATP-binding protein [Chromobacterium violaceum]
MSVEQQTNELLDAFSVAATGLFQISVKYLKHFEQGTYGCAIAKPTKRAKNALAVDREVLVVVSTFKDQQQRTVKFLLQEIQESLGRLETTMAVILHRDHDGNSKLRNWGRDVGVSVLPLLDGESLQSSDSLERALCVELYSHDPFDVTGPVSDDANFFGRRDEAIELARKLQKGQIRSCLGIRKIGKTSILNRVLHEIQTAHNCTCVMVDCSRDDIWQLDAAKLLGSVALTAELAVANSSSYSKLSVITKKIEVAEGRQRLENAIKSVQRPFVLVFDEVDYITPGSPTNPQWQSDFNVFWRNLRAVYQEAARERSVFSVLVAGVSTYWFSVESIDGVENSVLAFVPDEYLSPMPTGASVAMLKRLGRIAGFQVEDEAAEYIAKATGNMPYWSRKCASYINRKIPIAERPCSISMSRIESMVTSFVQEEGGAIAEVALRHLFRVYPRLYEAATLCHSGDGQRVADSEKRVLRRYGVLKEDNSSLSGQMMITGFDAFVRNQPSNQTAVSKALDEKAVVVDLGVNEWAEELAAIGKRRNIIERKLRELALNFLRFDSMSNGKLPELLSRVISVLPESQRATMAHLTVEESIAKFLWTDLVKLMGKEWQLFEKIFGGKADFSQHCDVINDRFDAHAKAADAADFAMYRRSLKYIEDRIAKVQ